MPKELTPDEVFGNNQERDANICNDFALNELDFPELAKKYELTEQRILQILIKNRVYKLIDKDWEKTKRINRLRRWIKKRPDTMKDTLEVQQELRKEIEGDKPLIDQSNHYTTKVYVWETSENSNPILSTELPEDNSRIQEQI